MTLLVATSLGGAVLWQVQSEGRSQGLARAGDPAARTVRNGPPARDPRSYAVVDHPDAWQFAHLPPLRTFPEGLPADVATALGPPVYGMNRHLAQRVSATGPGAVWLVPANRHVCVVARRGRQVGAACTTTSAAIARGIAFMDIDAAGRLRDLLTGR